MKDFKMEKYLQKIVESVRFGLHPTFERKQAYEEVYPSPLDDEISYTRIGWREYEMPITICWQTETGKTENTIIEHNIHFKGKGKWREVSVLFNKNDI